MPRRFVGVITMDQKFAALGPGLISLSAFFVEEHAARVYDRECIYQVALCMQHHIRSGLSSSLE